MRDFGFEWRNRTRRPQNPRSEIPNPKSPRSYQRQTRQARLRGQRNALIHTLVRNGPVRPLTNEAVSNRRVCLPFGPGFGTSVEGLFLPAESSEHAEEEIILRSQRKPFTLRREAERRIQLIPNGFHTIGGIMPYKKLMLVERRRHSLVGTHEMSTTSTRCFPQRSRVCHVCSSTSR